MYDKIVEILRLEEHPVWGTFGALRINKEVFCATLEPPDVANLTNRSNILPGQYICSQRKSERYGQTFEIMNVPGRTDVLFHAGNVVKHTKGCVLLGQYWGKLRGDRAVLNSGNTFKAFINVMGLEDFFLTITEHP